jgi:hypothetical protein
MNATNSTGAILTVTLALPGGLAANTIGHGVQSGRIYGKIRYLSFASTSGKFNIRAYIEK